MADDFGRAVYQLDAELGPLRKGLAEARQTIAGAGKAAETAFSGQASGAVKTFGGHIDQLRGRLDTLQNSSGGKAVLQGIGLGAGVTAFGLLRGAISQVTDFLGDSVTAYREEEDSVSRLGASLKANIPAWDGNTAAIEKVLTARMALGFSDDEQRASLTLLVGATHDVTKALEIERTAMDLARFKRISLADASEALIKVEAGSFRILKSLGIVLKDGATQQDALNAVQRVAMGQTLEYANTDLGKLETAQIKVNEAQEKFGKGLSHLEAELLPAAAGVIEALAGNLDRLGANTEREVNQIGDVWNYVFDTWEQRTARAAAATEAADHKMVTATEHMRGDISRNFAAMADSAQTEIAIAVHAADDWVTALDRDAKAALDGYFDPIITHDRLMADEAALSAARRVLASKTASAAEKADALSTIHTLEKSTTEARINLLEAGKLSKKEQATLLADLKTDWKNSTGAAKAQIAALIAKIEELERRSNVTITVGGQGTGQSHARAGGGSVWPGQAFMVGEHGEELFWPKTLGTIVPHDVTESLARAMREMQTARVAMPSMSAAMVGALSTSDVRQPAAVSTSYGDTSIVVNLQVDRLDASSPQQVRDVMRQIGQELQLSLVRTPTSFALGRR
jgi:hypothetical protein